MAVPEQMLSALDHLVYNYMCHRDVKPENTLYWENRDSCTFQLADLGLTNHGLLATTKSGTSYYAAPELYPEYGQSAQLPVAHFDGCGLSKSRAQVSPITAAPPARLTPRPAHAREPRSEPGSGCSGRRV
ncbi:hypothetical protein C7999DRAFT_36280 [Corynascus novoguineensis]|uniref:Protein kinase domain-containing protein n=1 Tax=Corynascus novoguineensis TaxID=1126955 RepID=A0AAN7CJV0_9PEZI|nr:hypothetical protein C7999DRAFT_36280 [Corynascus novoguineensis]